MLVLVIDYKKDYLLKYETDKLEAMGFYQVEADFELIKEKMSQKVTDNMYVLLNSFEEFKLYMDTFKGNCMFCSDYLTSAGYKVGGFDVFRFIYNSYTEGSEEEKRCIKFCKEVWNKDFKSLSPQEKYDAIWYIASDEIVIR